MDKQKLEKNRRNIMLNFFLIREVYHHLASIQHIPDAMNRFYKYLGVSSDTYNKIIMTGYGDYREAAKKLVRSGFSDTLFRSDSPTEIKASQDIKDRAIQYLAEEKGVNDNTLLNFRQLLQAHIEAIYDADNALMVIKVFQLIKHIHDDSEGIDQIRDFIQMMEEAEIDTDTSKHRTQKQQIQDIIDFYQKCIEEVENEET